MPCFLFILNQNYLTYNTYRIHRIPKQPATNNSDSNNKQLFSWRGRRNIPIAYSNHSDESKINAIQISNVIIGFFNILFVEPGILTPILQIDLRSIMKPTCNKMRHSEYE